MSVEIDRLEVTIEGSANQANKALTSLQEKLKETIRVLNNANTQSGNSFKALDTVSKNLAKDITSDFNRMSNAVKKDLQSLASEMVKDFDFNKRLNYNYFNKIIAKTKESALIAKDVESSYLAAYNAIKNTTFSISNFSDFIDKSEWKNLQKTLPKSFITSKASKGGDDIDSQYKELQQQFGKGLFPEANTAAEQLRVLANIVKTVRDNTTDVAKSTQDWTLAVDSLYEKLENATNIAEILIKNSRKPLSEQIAEYSKRIDEARGRLQILQRVQTQSAVQSDIERENSTIQRYTAALEAVRAEQEQVQKSKPNGTIAEFAKQLQSSSTTFEKVSTQLTEVSSRLASLNGAELSNFAKSLREVSDSAIASQNAFKGNTLGAFISNMQKLETLDGSKIALLGESIEKLSLGINTLSNIQISNTDGINSVVSALSKIAKVNLTTFDIPKLEQIGAGLKLFATELESARTIDRNIINMTNALAKLAQNANNIPIVSQSLGALGVELTKFVNSMSAVRVVPTEITQFTQAIAQLANAGNKTLVTATNLNALSQSLLQFFTDMQNAPQVSQNVIQLTQALGQLQNIRGGTNSLNQSISALGSGSSVISSLSTSLNNLGITFGSLNNQASGLFGNLLQGFGRVATGSSQMVLGAGQAVAGFGGLIAILIRLKTETITIPEALQGLRNNLIRLKDGFVNLTKGVITFISSFANFKNMISSVGGIIQKIASKFKGYQDGIKGMITTNNKLAQNYNKLASAIGMFYAKYFLVMRIIKKIWEAANSSMDYIETYNYFQVALNKIGADSVEKAEEIGADTAEAYADSFKTKLNDLTQKMSGFTVGDSGVLIDTGNIGLGLDPNQLMNFQAQILAVTNSAGMLGKTSINTTKALSMLSADLSSLTNTDLSTVMQNLQSGLIGQSRSLYKYGIDITNTSLKQLALEYGIKKSVSAMTQQEKMQLRMLAILRQSRVAWGDQANTVNSVANQYRILRQQLANVGRTIGNLLIPILQKVLPVLNGMAIIVNRLLSALGVKLFGDNWLKGIMGGISGGNIEVDDSGLEDVADSADDAADGLDKASKKAKELKSQLQGVDELNVLTSDSDSDSDSGSSSVDDGTGGLIDLSGEIADALADYESIWEQALKNSENEAEKWAQKISNAFSDTFTLGSTIGDAIIQALNNIPWDKIKETARRAGSKTASFFNGFISPELLDGIGQTFAQKLNTEFEFLNSFGNVFSFTNLGESVATGLNSYLETIDWDLQLKTFSTWGEGIAETLNGFLEVADFDLIGETFAKKIDNVATFLDSFQEKFNFTQLGADIKQGIESFVNSIDWNTIFSVANGWGKGIAEAINARTGLDISDLKVGQNIGKLFRNSINTGIEFIDGFVGELDFKYIGLNIRDLLAEGLSFDWVKVRKSADKIGTGIAEIINGITQKNGQNLSGLEIVGKTIKNSLNTIISAVDGFAKNIDWGALGTDLRDGIQQILNIDWTKLESAFETAGNGLAKALNNLFSPNKDDKTLGQSLGKALAGAFNSLVGFVDEFLQEFDGAQFGRNISQTVQTAFATIDWGQAASAITGFIGYELDLIAGIVDGIEWEKLPSQIVSALMGILKDAKWGDLIGGTINIAVSLLKAVIDIEAGLVEVYKDIAKTILNYFTDKIKEAGWDKDNSLLENGKYLIIGIFNGIVDFMANVGTWIWENIFSPFVQGFKDIFGIHSPAKDPEIVSLGEFLIEGVFSGIVNFMKNIGSWIKEHIFDKFTAGVKNAFKKGVDIAINIKSKVAKGTQAILDLFKSTKKVTKQFIADTKEKATEAFTKFKDFWEKSKASELTKEFVANAKEKLSNGFKKLKDLWDSAINGKIARTFMAEAKEKLSDGFVKLRDLWNSATNGKITRDFIANAKEVATEKFTEIKNFFTSTATTVKNLTAKAFGDDSDSKFTAIKDFFGDFGDKAKNLFAKATGDDGGSTSVFSSIKKWFETGNETKEVTAKAKGDDSDETYQKIRDKFEQNGDITKNLNVNLKGTTDPTYGKTMGVFDDVDKKNNKNVTVNLGGKIADSFADVQDALKTQDKNLNIALTGTEDDSFKDIQNTFNSVTSSSKALSVVATAKWKDSDGDAEAMGNKLQSSWALKGKVLNASVSTDESATSVWDKLKKSWATTTKEGLGVNVKGSGSNISDLWHNNEGTGIRDKWTSGDHNLPVGAKASGLGDTWKDMSDTWDIIGANNKLDTQTKITKIGDAWSNLSSTWNSKNYTLGTSTKITTTANSLWTTLSNGWGSKKLSVGFKMANNAASNVFSKLQKHFNNNKIKVKVDLSNASKAVQNIVNGGKNALGGVYSQGTWKSIDQYASGGAPNHGSVFVAGEAGAEVVGHVNGRTEILNQSQMASVMYQATYNAMNAVMKQYNSNSGDTVVQIDGKEVARATQRVANDYMRRTGNPYFAY